MNIDQYRPVYDWPSSITFDPATTSSSSKLKRNALNFLSTIKVNVEEEKQGTELDESDINSESNKEKENEVVTLLPPELGGGMRMKGDLKTQYVNVSRVKTDKSHRIFLSWDRAYPAMVFSLVVPAQGGGINPKFVSKSNTLAIPRPDGEEANDDLEISDRGSSHTEEETDGDDDTKGVSYGMLLDRNDFLDPALLSTRPVSPIAGNPPRLSVDESHSISPQVKKNKRFDEEDDNGSVNNNNNITFTKRNKQDLSWDVNYSFNLLEDSEIKQGKHRIVQNLPSARFSVIPYIKTKVLKEELNSLFRKKNPDLSQDLTLSKIRRLKREMLERAKTADCEFSTVALAYVYFEKLILKGVVHKANRKVVAFTCLLIAYKFNESAKEKMIVLLSEIARENKIPQTEIFSTEFAVFAHLRFNLNLPGRDYFEHFVRILRVVDVAPTEYLRGRPDEVTNVLKKLARQKKVLKEEEEDTRSTTSSSSSSDKDHQEESHAS